jgi:hypothetical protein
MSPAWLLHDGQSFVDALVLSHDEQAARLASIVPEAIPAAVVAGDPCFDRLRASRPLRGAYRRTLAVEPNTTVVTISSTWGSHSLLGSWPDLVRELLSELPVDSYRVLLVAHPNVWYAHGPWQLRSWLADATRAGLTVIDPLAGWQQAILASDMVIGDYGAVTGYAAALGTPTLLGAVRTTDVVEGTAIDALGRQAPLLDRRRPLRGQIRAAMAAHTPDRFSDVASLTSGAPDESGIRLRALFYRLLALPEPATDLAVHPYPTADLPAGRPRVSAAYVDGSVRRDSDSAHIQLRRLPADVWHHRPPLSPLPDSHLVVHINHPLRTLRSNAGILYCYHDEFATTEQAWFTTTLERWPTCVIAAIIYPDHCVVYAGANRVARLSTAGRATAAQSLASAIYLWLSHGHRWDDLPALLWLDTGTDAAPVQVSNRPG